MLTVLLPTYNGARTLPATLDAFCHLDSPSGGWRLIVVDNGSTDRTMDVLACFDGRLPLTCLRESRRGKNTALNTGLSRLSGDLTVFTDDDVLPNPLWLKQMRSAADSQPAFSIFGGPVEPRWEEPPQEWVLKWVPLDPTYAVTLPTAEGPTEASRVFGPNMALRTSIFESGHRFDEGIGPKGSNYAQGSEAEFLKRLSGMGLKAWHIKDAVVGHMIRSFQMTPKWVLSRAVRFGRGQYRIATGVPLNDVTCVFGIPGHMFRHMLLQSLRVARARLGGGAEEAFKERWKLNFMIGQAVEARKVSKESALHPRNGRPEDTLLLR